MTNAVDKNQPFLAENLVNDPVVTFTKFEETGKIAFERLRRDLFKVFGKPADTIYDAASERRIDPL